MILIFLQKKLGSQSVKIKSSVGEFQGLILYTFFKGCQHPGGSFIYWVHVTSPTCKANVQSTKTSHAWNDIVSKNHERKKGYILSEIPQWKVLAGTEFWTCDPPPPQIFFDLQLHLPYRIWPFSWLHTVEPHWSGQYSGGPLCSSNQQTVWRLSRLSQSL